MTEAKFKIGDKVVSLYKPEEEFTVKTIIQEDWGFSYRVINDEHTRAFLETDLEAAKVAQDSGDSHA